MFDKWTPNQQVDIVANPDFYFGKPKVDRIVMIPMPDDTVAGLALEAGQIDLGEFREPMVIDRFKDLKNFVVMREQSSGIWSIWFNMKEKPFDNVLVRRAVAHAIDKKALVDKILTGIAYTSDSYIPSVAGGHTVADGLPSYPFDPARAKKLLVDAGYPNGVDVTLTTTKLAPWPLIVPFVKESLDKAGIRCKLEEMEHAAYSERRAKGSYQFIVQGTGGPPDPHRWTPAFHTAQHPPGGQNLAFYRGVDDLIDKGQSEVDPKKRREIYKQLEDRILKDLPALPLYVLGTQSIARTIVKGYKPGVMNDPDFKDVSIQK